MAVDYANDQHGVRLDRKNDQMRFMTMQPDRPLVAAMFMSGMGMLSDKSQCRQQTITITLGLSGAELPHTVSVDIR